MNPARRARVPSAARRFDSGDDRIAPLADSLEQLPKRLRAVKSEPLAGKCLSPSSPTQSEKKWDAFALDHQLPVGAMFFSVGRMGRVAWR
jgi:hypothetical protein